MTFQKNDPEEVEALWQEYFTTRSSKTISKLAVAYEPLVRKIVGVYLKKKPANLEYDDLFQAGRMGLLDAISRFDPENDKGASFKTYASIRIRGSILDEINSMDWTPRSVRKNIKTVIKSIEKYYEHGHDEPTLISLISEDTDFNEKTVSTVMSQMNKTHIVNMEPEVVESHHQEVEMEDQEFMVWLTMSINEYFLEEEKMFIHLKYFQELDNKTIASQLGLPVKDLTLLRKQILYKFSILLNKEDPDIEEPPGIIWPKEYRKKLAERKRNRNISKKTANKLPHLDIELDLKP